MAVVSLFKIREVAKKRVLKKVFLKTKKNQIYKRNRAYKQIFCSPVVFLIFRNFFLNNLKNIFFSVISCGFSNNLVWLRQTKDKVSINYLLLKHFWLRKFEYSNFQNLIYNVNYFGNSNLFLNGGVSKYQFFSEYWRKGISAYKRVHLILKNQKPRIKFVKRPPWKASKWLRRFLFRKNRVSRVNNFTSAISSTKTKLISNLALQFNQKIDLYGHYNRIKEERVLRFNYFKLFQKTRRFRRSSSWLPAKFRPWRRRIIFKTDGVLGTLQWYEGWRKRLVLDRQLFKLYRSKARLPWCFYLPVSHYTRTEFFGRNYTGFLSLYNFAHSFSILKLFDLPYTTTFFVIVRKRFWPFLLNFFSFLKFVNLSRIYLTNGSTKFSFFLDSKFKWFKNYWWRLFIWIKRLLISFKCFSLLLVKIFFNVFSKELGSIGYIFFSEFSVESDIGYIDSKFVFQKKLTKTNFFNTVDREVYTLGNLFDLFFNQIFYLNSIYAIREKLLLNYGLALSNKNKIFNDYNNLKQFVVLGGLYSYLLNLDFSVLPAQNGFFSFMFTKLSGLYHLISSSKRNFLFGSKTYFLKYFKFLIKLRSYCFYFIHLAVSKLKMIHQNLLYGLTNRLYPFFAGQIILIGFREFTLTNGLVSNNEGVVDFSSFDLLINVAYMLSSFNKIFEILNLLNFDRTFLEFVYFFIISNFVFFLNNKIFRSSSLSLLRANVEKLFVIVSDFSLSLNNLFSRTGGIFKIHLLFYPIILSSLDDLFKNGVLNDSFFSIILKQSLYYLNFLRFFNKFNNMTNYLVVNKRHFSSTSAVTLINRFYFFSPILKIFFVKFLGYGGFQRTKLFKFLSINTSNTIKRLFFFKNLQFFFLIFFYSSKLKSTVFVFDNFLGLSKKFDWMLRNESYFLNVSYFHDSSEYFLDKNIFLFSTKRLSSCFANLYFFSRINVFSRSMIFTSFNVNRVFRDEWVFNFPFFFDLSSFGSRLYLFFSFSLLNFFLFFNSFNSLRNLSFCVLGFSFRRKNIKRNQFFFVEPVEDSLTIFYNDFFNNLRLFYGFFELNCLKYNISRNLTFVLDELTKHSKVISYYFRFLIKKTKYLGKYHTSKFFFNSRKIYDYPIFINKVSGKILKYLNSLASRFIQFRQILFSAIILKIRNENVDLLFHFFTWLVSPNLLTFSPFLLSFIHVSIVNFIFVELLFFVFFSKLLAFGVSYSSLFRYIVFIYNKSYLIERIDLFYVWRSNFMSYLFINNHNFFYQFWCQNKYINVKKYYFGFLLNCFTGILKLPTNNFTANCLTNLVGSWKFFSIVKTNQENNFLFMENCFVPISSKIFGRIKIFNKRFWRWRSNGILLFFFFLFVIFLRKLLFVSDIFLNSRSAKDFLALAIRELFLVDFIKFIVVEKFFFKTLNSKNFFSINKKISDCVLSYSKNLFVRKFICTFSIRLINFVKIFFLIFCRWNFLHWFSRNSLINRWQQIFVKNHVKRSTKRWSTVLYKFREKRFLWWRENYASRLFSPHFSFLVPKRYRRLRRYKSKRIYFIWKDRNVVQEDNLPLNIDWEAQKILMRGNNKRGVFYDNLIVNFHQKRIEFENREANRMKTVVVKKKKRPYLWRFFKSPNPKIFFKELFSFDRLIFAVYQLININNNFFANFIRERRLVSENSFFDTSNRFAGKNWTSKNKKKKKIDLKFNRLRNIEPILKLSNKLLFYQSFFHVFQIFYSYFNYFLGVKNLFWSWLKNFNLTLFNDFLCVKNVFTNFRNSSTNTSSKQFIKSKRFFERLKLKRFLKRQKLTNWRRRSLFRRRLRRWLRRRNRWILNSYYFHQYNFNLNRYNLSRRFWKRVNKLFFSVRYKQYWHKSFAYSENNRFFSNRFSPYYGWFDLLSLFEASKRKFFVKKGRMGLTASNLFVKRLEMFKNLHKKWKLKKFTYILELFRFFHEVARNLSHTRYSPLLSNKINFLLHKPDFLRLKTGFYSVKGKSNSHKFKTNYFKGNSKYWKFRMDFRRSKPYSVRVRSNWIRTFKRLKILNKFKKWNFSNRYLQIKKSLIFKDLDNSSKRFLKVRRWNLKKRDRIVNKIFRLSSFYKWLNYMRYCYSTFCWKLNIKRRKKSRSYFRRLKKLIISPTIFYLYCLKIVSLADVKVIFTSSSIFFNRYCSFTSYANSCLKNRRIPLVSFLSNLRFNYKNFVNLYKANLYKSGYSVRRKIFGSTGMRLKYFGNRVYWYKSKWYNFKWIRAKRYYLTPKLMLSTVRFCEMNWFLLSNNFLKQFSRVRIVNYSKNFSKHFNFINFGFYKIGLFFYRRLFLFFVLKRFFWFLFDRLSFLVNFLKNKVFKFKKLGFIYKFSVLIFINCTTFFIKYYYLKKFMRFFVGIFLFNFTFYYSIFLAFLSNIFVYNLILSQFDGFVFYFFPMFSQIKRTNVLSLTGIYAIVLLLPTVYNLFGNFWFNSSFSIVATLTNRLLINFMFDHYYILGIKHLFNSCNTNIRLYKSRFITRRSLLSIKKFNISKRFWFF